MDITLLAINWTSVGYKAAQLLFSLIHPSYPARIWTLYNRKMV